MSIRDEARAGHREIEAARNYTARGWRIVPVPFKSKAPVLPAWQSLRLEPDDLDQYFDGGASNIGVLLGDPSGGVTDVDLDCPEAVRLAPMFLPPTRSRFGRASKRASHCLYEVTTPVETEKFADPDVPDDEKAMIVELRSTGGQTIVPGSVHEGGEAVTWDENGELASTDGATLRRAVADLAAASLLARHWPMEGSRHDAALAAAGFLVRGGVDEARVVQLIYQAALAAGDDEATDRKRDVLTTVAKLAAGEPVTGGPTLAEVLRGDGVKVVAAIKKWLGLQGPALAEPLTDVTNAARFVADHGPVLRYCYVWSAWLHFDGRRWRRDAGDVTVRCAKETARAWFAEAARASDDGRRKALARWAVYSNSEPGIRRMLTLAQAELAITPDQLDADLWVLNCPNGALELRTGHLRPHRREDFITKMTGAEYHADARHETWDRFIEGAIPDEGARDYAQRYAGYALTGSTREEVFAFCRGPAGSGKSTYTEGLRRTWGDYAVSADFGTFLQKKPSDGPSEDTARLASARLVTSVETRDGQRLAEGRLKMLTGGDTVPARRLYERTFEFVPRFKLLLASNYRPRASAADDGLWRRLRELPFPTARLRREDRDDSIKAIVTDPTQAGAAILAWAVEGCVRWLAQGLGEPPAVLAATEEYRQEQDVVGEFVRAACVVEAGAWISRRELRDALEGWAREEGLREIPGGRTVAQALRALGCPEKGRRGVRGWDGLRLRIVTDPEPEPAAAPEPAREVVTPWS